ncbi:2-keto-3-deoxy-L-rhamnonate aldolase RhmA [Arthrobacter pascens]|uniref:aldolase/citrate lyase family protein n=1 Tax=Arthrobacter pascens TaxID=1677 RepID=UPI002783A4D9|nr:aldolase/citrate lyase family protein [Arthrobacter pascens]MDQ0634340.1 2-keto-3-deoxy-L-rhamnonate aldolase RhmA [Arthrobacter pascens]
MTGMTPAMGMFPNVACFRRPSRNIGLGIRRAGVEAADEILATPGLDTVIIGPGDLALSLGVPMGSEEHWTAVDRVLTSAAAHGVSTGAFCFTLPDVERYLTAGARLILAGGDLNWTMGGAMAEWHSILALRPAAEPLGTH